MKRSVFRYKALAVALGFILGLSACMGTEPRKLSSNSSTSQNPREDTVDKFVLELAYRDTLTGGATNRTVAIQGRASSQANLFVTICGADASKCACSFFKSSDTTTAYAATTKAVNQEINVMSCVVPAGIVDADMGDLFVRLTDTTGKINSGLMRVKSQLSLADIIGELPQGQIRKVFGYTCTRTFLEGSGISGNNIDCNVAGMQLGFLGAD